MALLKAAAGSRAKHAPVKPQANDCWRFDPAADPRFVAAMEAKASQSNAHY